MSAARRMKHRQKIPCRRCPKEGEGTDGLRVVAHDRAVHGRAPPYTHSRHLEPTWILVLWRDLAARHGGPRADVKLPTDGKLPT
eukprot:1503479-Prymnesium_polylepis.2